MPRLPRPAARPRGRNGGGYRSRLASGTCGRYHRPVPCPRRLPAAALAALLALAAGAAARADEPPKWGVISRPKGFSSIRVVATAGLSVYLDDVPVGTTDVLRQGLAIEDLPAGTYTLRVEQAGFEPKVVSVTVAEGDTKEVRILGLRPKPTPTPPPPAPVATAPPAGSPPPPTPVPVRSVIFERKAVPGGTLVTGAASSPSDVLPLLDRLGRECACPAALEEMKKRKDGLYEFRVRLSRGTPTPAPPGRPPSSG